MIALITHYMAPLMFGGLIAFLIIGYPAAFSLAAVGLFSGLVAIELGLFPPGFLGNLTYQIFRWLSATLDYTYTDTQSSEAGAGYVENRVRAALNASFY